jgi:hypothetical protein
MRTWYGNQNRSSPDYNYGAASCDSKAVLDVKGDVYMRNRLNVNDMNKNKIIGTWIAEPHIFYDTRDIDVLFRDPDDSSRILVKSETRPFQFIINEYPGLVVGTVNYLTEYRGFEFIGNGKITNILANGTLNQEVMRTSFWIQLQNEQSTYPTSNIFSFKNPNTRATTVTCQVTSSGITIAYENSVDSPFSFTTPYTIQKNTWYNIQVQLPGGSDNVPQAIADSDPNDNETFRRSYVGLWINTIPQTLTLNGTAVSSDLSGIYIDLELGGNTENIIVGMFMHWTGYAFEDLTEAVVADRKLNAIQNAYRYGHPSEMLVVGGDASVSGKLSVGSTNPTEALEVTGNVVVTGSMTATSFSFTGGLDATNITGVLPVLHGGTGVTESTGTGKVVLSVSPTLTGSVGINTSTSPTEALEVTGNTVVSGSLDVGSVLYLTSGSVPSGVDTIVDAANKTNTYISFKEAGAVNDWAYLRQIGNNNEYHMALDFHDDGSDARFSIRDVQSTASPDVITTRFTVKSGGNVGIGVPDPQYALDVSGDINFTGDLRKNGAIVSSGGLDPIVSLGPWVDDASELALHHSSLDGFTNYALRQDDNGVTRINSSSTGVLFDYGSVERMRVHSNGNVGVNNTGPVYTLDVGGTIRASGDVIAFSDGRYKTDVQRIDGALEKVGRVSGYTFRMKDGTERRAGVIAQEIREVLPEVVVGDEEAGYNVAYGNMAGLFIEAIKELKARVETLEARLEKS